MAYKPDWVKAEEKKIKAMLKDMEDRNVLDMMKVTVCDGITDYQVLSVYRYKGGICIDIGGRKTQKKK